MRKELAAALSRAGSYKYGEQRQPPKWHPSQAGRQAGRVWTRVCSQQACTVTSLSMAVHTVIELISLRWTCSNLSVQKITWELTQMQTLSPAHPHQRTDSVPVRWDSEMWIFKAPLNFKKHSSRQYWGRCWMKLNDKCFPSEILLFSLLRAIYLLSAPMDHHPHIKSGSGN